MIRISTSFLVHFALASTVTIAASGCTTVQVTKVKEPEPTSWTFWFNPLNLWDELTDSGPAEPDTKAKGVRYFLPKPYLLVTPLPKGNVRVDVVYLPDPDQEYAVDVRVYIATQDFKMEFAADNDDRGKGFLEKVTYQPKDPTVFSQIVTEAGKMGKTIIDDKKKEKDAEEQKRKTAASKLDELKADEQVKKATLADKEHHLNVEKTKLQRFNIRNENPTGDKLSEKETLEDAEATAKRERDLAKDAYDIAVGTRTTFENRNPTASSTPADSSSPKRNMSPTDASLPGPALFEIKEGEELLSLQLVKTEFTVKSDPENGQMKLKTFMPVSNGTPTERGKAPFTEPLPPKISTAVAGNHIIPFTFAQNIEAIRYSVDMIQGRVRKKLEERYWKQNGSTLRLTLPANEFSGDWKIELITDADSFTWEIKLQ